MILLQFIILIAVLKDSTSMCGINYRNTPLVILDHEGCCESLHTMSSNPLHQVDHIEFTDMIQHVKTKSKVVIIFVEETLSVEDIAAKDVIGTPYNYLRRGIRQKRVKYFPSVLDSYLLLAQKFPQNSNNTLHLSHELILPDDCTKYFYVFFIDGTNETRVESLRRHDTLIAEVYHAIRKKHSGYVTGIYTGKINRVLRDAMPFNPHTQLPKQAEDSIRVESEGALFNFRGLRFVSPLRTAKLVQEPLVGEETWFRRKMDTQLCTKMSYTDFELQFDFKFTKGGWKLDKVILLEGGEQVGQTTMGVGAPWGFSYVCSDPLIINNNRDCSSIIIDSYKIQAFEPIPLHKGESNHSTGDNTTKSDDNDTSCHDNKQNGTTTNRNQTKCSCNRNQNKCSCNRNHNKCSCNDERKIFGQSVHCGHHFNIAIISCLFVVLLFLVILFYGIIMIMNCQTNDRYDDQHGKYPSKLQIPSKNQ